MIRLIHLGTPSGQPPLLAVPGIDGTIGSFKPEVNLLARTREVIVVDYSAETNVTLEDLTAEITTVAKTESHPVIDVLGQSIGTVLAAQLAASHDLPVRKVALMSTFTILNWWLLRWAVRFMRITPGWLYRITSPLTIILSCGPVGDGWNHPAFAATHDSNQNAIAKRTKWEINRDFGVDLARLQLPTLILMGEKDRFVPSAKAELNKLRGMFAERPVIVESVPNAGHIFLPSSAVALASQKIESFLE